MCGYYSDEHRLRYRPFVPNSAELVERTRLIEASMAGERVPESAWAAFFSPACGAIELAHFERMFAARKAAVTYLAMRSGASLPQRAVSSFICVAD